MPGAAAERRPLHSPVKQHPAPRREPHQDSLWFAQPVEDESGYLSRLLAVEEMSGACDELEVILGVALQIQTSFAAVRAPPSCPVLSTPRGSIRSSFTSCSA